MDVRRCGARREARRPGSLCHRGLPGSAVLGRFATGLPASAGRVRRAEARETPTLFALVHRAGEVTDPGCTDEAAGALIERF
jgi:hypothetical protein